MLTAEQQRFLEASYGLSWVTADLLLSDAGIAHAKAGQQGGGLHAADGTAREFLGHYSTLPKGIARTEITQAPGEWPVSTSTLVVPWTAITAHRRTLTPAALDRLRVTRKTFGTHHASHPVWHHPEQIRRVGPSEDLHPDDRAEHARLSDEFYRDVVGPWQEDARRLDADLRAAVLACLPLAADDPEPTDLIGFLAAMETAS